MNRQGVSEITLHHGDCAEVLAGMPGGCIDLTVTSPPYDNLRTYNGFTFDFEAIARELYRVTKRGGVVVWVVGDATIKGSETGTSFKQALYFKEIGFNLHDTMIYQRSSPPLTHNRYEQHFEYMFILSKGRPRTFNAITEPKLYKDTRTDKAFRRESNGRFDMGFCKQNDSKIRNNVWKFNAGGGQASTDKIAYGHPAIFPEKLAQDHILSWSNEGDTVLDPFTGSGTTGKMAVLNNRNFVGIEISDEYLEIAKERIEKATITTTAAPSFS